MTHRRILFLFLAFLTILSGSTYLVLYRTGAAKDFVQELIGRTIRRHLFKLDAAEIDLTGGKVTIRDFQLNDPKKQGDTSPILSISRVEVDVETNPLGGIGAVRQVSLDGLEINLSLVAGEVPDFSQILAQAGVEPATGAEFTLPAIRITNSRVRLTVAPGRPSIPFTELNLTLLPVEDEPGRMQLQGSMLSPMGHTARIQGGGDPRAQTFRAVVILEDIPILPEKASVFREEAAQFLDAARVKGDLQKVTAWVEFDSTKPDADAPPYSGGFRMDFAAVEITPPAFPYEITGASGTLFATTADGGTLKVQIDKKGVDGDLAVRGSVKRCFEADRLVDLRVDATDILIGSRLHNAIDRGTLEEIKEVKAALSPTSGRLGASLRIFNKTAGARLEIMSELSLDGVDARYHGFADRDGKRYGFPIQIRKIRGKIAAHPGRIALQDIRAEAADGAPIKIHGHVDFGDDGPRDSDIDIEVTGLQFSDSVRAALAHTLDDGKAVYDEYRPSGKTDVTVELRRRGGLMGYSIELRPQLASAAYSLFPYPVDALRGKVRIANTGVWIDLSGVRRDAKVEIDGRFLFGDDESAKGPRSELWIKGTDLAFDTEMYQAASSFNADIGKHWLRVEPRGRINTEVTMWQEAGEKDFSYDVHLNIDKGSVLVKDLPMPIDQLAGDLFFHGKGGVSRCDISPLRGVIRNGNDEPPARVLVQGSILDIGGDLQADVTSIVQRLRLTPGLGKALGKGEVLDVATWNSLKLNGFTDVTAHHVLQPGAETLTGEYTVRLRNVSCDAETLPGKASDLHGEIIVKNGRATFKRLEGKMKETTVTVSGGEVYQKDGNTIVEFVANADSFPIDHTLANAMSGVVSKAFLARKMKGRARLNQVVVEFSFPEGDAFTSKFSGNIEARDIFMEVGLPGGHSLKHLTGTVNITHGFADANGGELAGRLTGARFELSDHQIHQIEGDFEIDAVRLILRKLTFEAAGGRVQGDDSESFRYDFTEQGRIRAFLNFNNLRLSQLLKSKALAHSKVRGVVNGHLRIKNLEGGDFLGMKASGEVGVHNGRLGTVPLFSAIYKHIKEERRPQFNTGRVVFTIDDQRIEFSEFSAKSSLIKIGGKGTLDMDGYMNIDLNVPRLFGAATDILILPPLLNEMFAKMVRFKVFGYLRNPYIEPKLPFGGGFKRQPLAPIAPVPVASGPRDASSN